MTYRSINILDAIEQIGESATQELISDFLVVKIRISNTFCSIMRLILRRENFDHPSCFRRRKEDCGILHAHAQAALDLRKRQSVSLKIR